MKRNSHQHRALAIIIAIAAFALSMVDGFAPNRVIPWLIIACAFSAFWLEFG